MYLDRRQRSKAEQEICCKIYNFFFYEKEKKLKEKSLWTDLLDLLLNEINDIGKVLRGELQKLSTLQILLLFEYIMNAWLLGETSLISVI